MLFDFDLLVPLATSESSPTELLVPLTKGILTQIRVTFPPGAATLVYVVVRDRLNQILPANREGSLNFDNAVIVSNLKLSLNDPPYELRLLGWSPNTFFNHRINFQFDVSPGRGQDWEVFFTQLFGTTDA